MFVQMNLISTKKADWHIALSSYLFEVIKPISEENFESSQISVMCHSVYPFISSNFGF